MDFFVNSQNQNKYLGIWIWSYLSLHSWHQNGMDQLHQFLKAGIILKLSLMLPFKDIVRENGNTAIKMFTVFLSNHYFSVCYNSIPKMVCSLCISKTCYQISSDRHHFHTWRFRMMAAMIMAIAPFG